SIYCLDARGELAGRVQGDAVLCLNADRRRFPWDMAVVRRLRSEVRKGSIDIVHSHNLAAQQYGVLATLGTNVRHVHTQHGANIHSQGFKDRLRARLLARFTDAIVAVSKSTADAMNGVYKIAPERIRVVHNGIQIRSSQEKTRSVAKKDLGIAEDTFVIGSVGRLAYVKGYDHLLTAWRILISDLCLLTSGKQFMLLLVGDGPERSNLEAQARELEINDSVIFAGVQEEPEDYLELMDLFILSSRSE
ncbi:unnamed protein product, partial [marine sediment metagenome]